MPVEQHYAICNNIDVSYFAGYGPTKITFGVPERLQLTYMRCQETDLVRNFYTRFLGDTWVARSHCLRRIRWTTVSCFLYRK